MNKIDLGFNFKDVKCVKMCSGKYECIIAPSMGAAVLRFHDFENDIEVFRYDKKVSADTINEMRQIWGLPTMYLPNRLDGGKLKTADGFYQFPINETNKGNYLHGWVFNREHEIECYSTQGNKCVLVTSYSFNQNDEMYDCFPLDFKLSYTFTLSEKGLLQEIYLTNNSDKILPVSISTHTCFNAPMCKNGSESSMRISVPIGKRCELNERCIPTEKLIELNDWDLEYKHGTKVPTGQALNDDMYTAEMNTVNGKPFYGSIITDTSNGHSIYNEVSKEFKFWNMWNDNGDKGYFCVEPMTAMINAPNLNLPNDVSGYHELHKGHTFKCWQRFFTE